LASRRPIGRSNVHGDVAVGREGFEQGHGDHLDCKDVEVDVTGTLIEADGRPSLRIGEGQ
jgi:hypothetical protein